MKGSMKLARLKGLAVGAVTAMLLLGIAESASAKPVRPDAATLKFVDKAKLPIAREVIRTFRRTKPSQRTVTRHTSQLIGMSHRNVTNISGEIPVRLAFDSSRVGMYLFSADFRGRTRPKNMVSVSISTYPNQVGNRGIYGFIMGRTKNDGPTNSWPMHWLMSAGYMRGSKDVSYLFDSCAAGGGLGGSKPVLSVPGLLAGMKQARKVLRQAAKRRPIRRQKDVFAGRTAPSVTKCEKKAWNPQV